MPATRKRAQIDASVGSLKSAVQCETSGSSAAYCPTVGPMRYRDEMTFSAVRPENEKSALSLTFSISSSFPAITQRTHSAARAEERSEPEVIAHCLRFAAFGQTEAPPTWKERRHAAGRRRVVPNARRRLRARNSAARKRSVHTGFINHLPQPCGGRWREVRLLRTPPARPRRVARGNRRSCACGAVGVGVGRLCRGRDGGFASRSGCRLIGCIYNLVLRDQAHLHGIGANANGTAPRGPSASSHVLNPSKGCVA